MKPSTSKECSTSKDKEELNEIFEKLHQNNLDVIRQENVRYKNKRKRNISESSIDEIIKKVTDNLENENDATSESNSDEEHEYLMWKCSEYDTYNSVSKQAVLSSIDILEKKLNEKNKKKVRNNCSTLDQMKSSEILWTSSTYIVKYIRSCILQHNWKALSYLVPFLFTHSKHHTCYIKEITFLTSLMFSNEDPSIMTNLKQCFTKSNNNCKNKFDIWYVDDN